MGEEDLKYKEGENNKEIWEDKEIRWWSERRRKLKREDKVFNKYRRRERIVKGI